ncbi:hypothetical protein D3C72_1728070 [compost metagenome]
MAVIADLQANRLAAEVGLVTDQGDLGRVGLLVEELGPEGEGIGRLGCRGIHHQQYAIGFANGLEGAFHTDLFHMVIGIAQTCSIHNVQGHAVDVDMFTQHVAGGTGDFGHDGRLAARKGIQQAGLAGIGTPGDHHCHAVPQQRALAGFAHHCG